MKAMYVVAVAAFTLVLAAVVFLISDGNVLFTLKALSQQMGRDLSSTFSIFADHKVPIIITAAILAVIDFVRRVPVIRSR